MGSDERFDSLSDALRERGVPLENWDVIRRVTDRIGIDSYHPGSGCFRAVRRDCGPDLNIGYGWTNGFTSYDEATEASGGRSISTAR